MKYQVLGGAPLEAATPLEVAQALRQQAMDWAPSVSVEDFIEGMAQRASQYCGHPIRIDSVDHFVADLVQHGFLTPVA